MLSILLEPLKELTNALGRRTLSKNFMESWIQHLAFH